MKHFNLREFACQCGECDSDGSEMSETFLEALDALRCICAFPLIISSGYRCELHPIERSKTAPGAHSSGIAADILLSGDKALAALRNAQNMGMFTGIGINQKGNGRFIHLDIAGDFEFGAPRPHIWSY
jgi:uncharacterized protein YcbK (DUF882 family)